MTSINNDYVKLEHQVKRLIFFFIIALLLSGITAFPIEWQLSIAHEWITKLEFDNSLTRWLNLTYTGIRETNLKYPFISYGTDWLAFAHIVIAIAFIGPLRDPVRNIWVIEFGIIACLAVFPLAVVAGSIRGIPFYWQLIDCSFGVVGGMVLWSCYKKVRRMEEVRGLGIGH